MTSTLTVMQKHLVIFNVLLKSLEQIFVWKWLEVITIFRFQGLYINYKCFICRKIAVRNDMCWGNLGDFLSWLMSTLIFLYRKYNNNNSEMYKIIWWLLDVFKQKCNSISTMITKIMSQHPCGKQWCFNTNRIIIEHKLCKNVTYKILIGFKYTMIFV